MMVPALRKRGISQLAAASADHECQLEPRQVSGDDRGPHLAAPPLFAVRCLCGHGARRSALDGADFGDGIRITQRHRGTLACDSLTMYHLAMYDT
jgi:hypothetical protein